MGDLKNAFRIGVGNAEKVNLGGGKATPKLDDNIQIYIYLYEVKLDGGCGVARMVLPALRSWEHGNELWLP